MEYSEIKSKSKEELIEIAEKLNLLKNGNSPKKSELINSIYTAFAEKMALTQLRACYLF